MNALSASPLLSRRQLHACLAVAMLFVFMPVAPVAAATSPLGFTLGKTTQRRSNIHCHGARSRIPASAS